MKITAHSAFAENILQCGFEFGVPDADYEITPEQLAHLQAYAGVIITKVHEDAPADAEPVAAPSKRARG